MIWRKLLYVLGAVIFIVVATEVILRLCDVEPFRVKPYQIQSTPSFCLLPDTQKGFALNPGQFDVRINEKVAYRCTHNNDSMRITRSPAADTTTFKKRIDLHGCSFIYGMGVSDEQTYPWLLQQAFPQYEIRNYAVPGYGNLQALLQLREQIQKQDLPDELILHYASFHDDRNGLSNPYRMALHYGFKNAHEEVVPKFAHSRIPFLNDSCPHSSGIQMCQISYENWETIYTSWAGRDISATINSLQTVYEYLTYPQESMEQKSEYIIRELNKLCTEHQVLFKVALITKDDRTAAVKKFCEQAAIEVVDMRLALPSEEWSHLPYDIHPNERAHRHFAERMMASLNKEQ